jgi:hypothetical protein
VDLLLQAVHTGLQLDQLGAKRNLVEALPYLVESLLYPLQAHNDHLVLGLQAIETLVDLVEVTIDFVEARTHALPGLLDEALHVGK